MGTAKKYRDYKSIDELPATLRVKDIAEFMGINTTKAYELVKREDFPSLKIGQRIITPKQAFENWLNTVVDSRR